MIQRQPLELEALGAFSQQFALAIFDAMPHLQQHAWMAQSGEADGLSLDVLAPSPTLDDERLMQIWVDEIGTPSIGFGPSHTHDSPNAAGISAIIDLATAILNDQLLIIEDIGGKYPGHADWLDLRAPDALVEELTSPYSSGRAVLKSWSGLADRAVDTEMV